MNAATRAKAMTNAGAMNFKVSELDGHKIEFEQASYGVDILSYQLNLGRSIEQAYPDICSRGAEGGLKWPLIRLQGGLEGLLLAMTDEAYLSKLREPLRNLCLLGIEVCISHPRIRALKADHDALLIQLATLVDLDLAREAAQVIGRARTSGVGPNCLAALGGVIAERLLGNPKAEAQQAEAFKQAKLDRTFAVPAKSTVKAFVDNDIIKFAKSASRDIDKHWEYADRGKAILCVTKDRVVLDRFKKSSNWLFPWPEASLTKLLIHSGHDPGIDSPWVPKELMEKAI